MEQNAFLRRHSIYDDMIPCPGPTCATALSLRSKMCDIDLSGSGDAGIIAIDWYDLAL
jgi:hypothetical protein